MKKRVDTVFSTRHVEGMERATALIIHDGKLSYRVYQWGRYSDHWLCELTSGDQVELYGGTIAVHVPRDGWTFDLDGTSRRLIPEESRVQ